MTAVQTERSARPPVPSAIAISLTSIVSLGVVALFLVVYAVGFSAAQEQRGQHQLYAQFRGLLDPDSPIAPATGGTIAPHTPIAMINAGAAGMHRLIVVEGTSSADLLDGPGHLRDTPLPGQPGDSVLVGKDLTSGGPFRHLTSFAAGDAAHADHRPGVFTYRVLDVRRKGDPIQPVASGSAELTLISATGSGLLGQVAPSRLVYVDALLQGSPVQPSGQHPEAVPSAELPGHSDPGAWPFVLLWVQALLIAGVGTAVAAWMWSRSGDDGGDGADVLDRRRGMWRAWLLGAPVIFGVLWGLATECSRLLPNIL